MTTNKIKIKRQIKNGKLEMDGTQSDKELSSSRVENHGLKSIMYKKKL